MSLERIAKPILIYTFILACFFIAFLAFKSVLNSIKTDATTEAFKTWVALVEVAVHLILLTVIQRYILSHKKIATTYFFAIGLMIIASLFLYVFFIGTAFSAFFEITFMVSSGMKGVAGGVFLYRLVANGNTHWSAKSNRG